MIKFKLKGPWIELRNLLRSYPKRLRYVEERIGQDIANALLERVKDKVPLEAEYKAYLESLAVVRLTGLRRAAGYAVISDRERVKIKEIATEDLRGKMVVYFYPSSGELISDVVPLLEMGNPWPVDMVPHGVPKGDVSIVHRAVSDGEMKWAREHATMVVSNNRGLFRRHGISWGKPTVKEDQAQELESVPDFMSMAIRAEFGINAAPNAHWRPAARWVMANLVNIIKKDEKIRLALHDSLFREHTLQKNSEYRTMTIRDFKKEAGSFQEKVIGR